MSVPYSEGKKRVMFGVASASLIRLICSAMTLRPTALTTVSKPMACQSRYRAQSRRGVQTPVCGQDVVIFGQVADNDVKALVLPFLKLLFLV